MEIFDNIFYRVAKFYYKRDGSSAFRAIGIVSYMQAAVVVDIFLFIRVLFLRHLDFQPYLKYGRTIAIVLALVVMTLNYFYFKDKYWRLSDRWREQEIENPSLRKMRGLLVVLGIVLPFVLFLLPFLIH